MEATLTSADVLAHHVPAATSPAHPHTVEAAAPAPVQRPDFYETHAGQALVERTDTARRQAIDSQPEYRMTDAAREWDAAHKMGRARAEFEQANKDRNVDADWRREGQRPTSMVEASSEHAEEAEAQKAAMAARAAAEEKGRGQAWREAYELGKEHVHSRAAYESAAELTEVGAKMLAKDAVALVAEGPVGEAMVLRDMAEIGARAPSVGTVVTGTAAGLAAAGIATEVTRAIAERAEQQPAVHAVVQAVSQASPALDSFHRGVWNVMDSGDKVISTVSHAVSEVAAPVTRPIEQVTHPYTERASHAVAHTLEAAGHAMAQATAPVMESLSHLQAKALTTVLEGYLKHGQASLSTEEAHHVIKELAHVNKGDTLVIEPHGVHVVPAGTKMPDFPAGAMKLDADMLREGLGIERAPVQAHAAVNAQAHAAPAAPAHDGRER